MGFSKDELEMIAAIRYIMGDEFSDEECLETYIEICEG